MKTGLALVPVLILIILISGCNGRKTGNTETGLKDPVIEPISSSPKENPESTSEIITTQITQDTFLISDLLPDPAIDHYSPGSLEPPAVRKAEAMPSPEIREEPGIMILKRQTVGQGQVILRKGRVSPEVFFTAIFDNDIFDYTDYYYTNGITLQFYHPVIGSLPLSRALPGLNNSLNYYGILLTQNMYTPLKLEDLQPRIGDRPFASYLTLTHQRISLSPDKYQRLQAELTLGILGPSSGGNLAQDLIHSNAPVGWVNQIENNLIVNYQLRFDQGVIHTNSMDVAFSVAGQAGTLYDNLAVGTFIRVGRTNDLYSSLFQTAIKDPSQKNRLRYYAGADLRQKFIIYDATLQGGLFGKEDVYSIDDKSIRRFVFNGALLLGLGIGRYSLEAEQVYVGPEFDGGRCHFWFRIKNIVRL